MKDKIKEKALIIQFIDETKTPKPKTKTHEAYSWFYQKYSEWLEDRLSTPSVTDEEIKRDIKREAELYQSDPAKTSFEISRAEYFAFCEGAKWMRDNHLPSKGEEIIFTDMELLAIIDHANSKGHITVKKNQHIVELILRALSLSKDTPQKSDELVELLGDILAEADQFGTLSEKMKGRIIKAEQALKQKGDIK